MARLVPFEYRIYDNCLEIIPKHAIEDNSVYTIKLNGLTTVDGREIPKESIDITTRMTPCYCSAYAVKILLDDFELPESDILFFIRQASRQAEYINGGKPKQDSDGRVAYEIEKYTETKATLDALTKAYVVGNNNAGMEGTVGDLTFKNGDNIENLRKLMNTLRSELKVWQDAIRGYKFEGKNSPTFALIGAHTRRATPAAKILNDYTRNVNMGRDMV